MEASAIGLMANGPCDISKNALQKIKTWIAVDGGIQHCLRLHLNPQIYVGDLDSAAPEALSHFPHIEKHIFQKDKDRSDLELALELAFSMTKDPLPIFGALGGRMDHTLYNLYLLSRFPGQMRFLSKEETVFCIEKEAKIRTAPGKILSLMPLGGQAQGVTTKGLQYELQDATLSKNFLSLSNVALGQEVTIAIAQGSLLCFLESSN